MTDKQEKQILFIFLSHCVESLYNRYYTSNVTEPESDAETFSHRFTDYGGQSVAFGTSITQFWEAFSSKFGDASGFGVFSMLETFPKNSG
jgi:hypothetical protein